MLFVLVFVTGTVFGSFMSCWLHRIHDGKSVVTGRSACRGCGKNLSWYELIPIISFVLQRGKCRSCKSRISWQDIFIETTTGLLFMWSYWLVSQMNMSAELTVSNLITLWVVMTTLVSVFVYDFRWQIIPDVIMVPSIAVVAVLQVLNGYLQGLQAIELVVNLATAAIVAGGFFLVQFIISDGRWIGGGDIRLGVFMGLALGWPDVVVALMIAYIVGALVSIGIVIARRKQMSSQIAFGTFLSVATVLTVFFGNEIVAWYIDLL